MKADVKITNKLKGEVKINLSKNDFKRVLTNLIDNGLSYGTKVVITLENSEKKAKIYVDDNGVGIKDTSKKNIFRPFFRGDNTARNLDKIGTGLGLAIVQGVVLSHGGSIKVEDSKSLGGARFVINLPRGE
ncbi:sensor histidine kinase [Pseudomonadota bacterium]